MLFQLIIIQVVTFAAIVLVLRKLLYAETAEQTQRLRMLTEENYKKEKELAEKIKQAEEAYQERLTRAKEDIRKLKEEAEKEIDESRKSAQDRAKEEAERIVREAVNAREKMRDEIQNEMQKDVPSAACQIFRDFLSPRAKAIIHRELLEEVINEIKKGEKSRFNVKVKKGELITAQPFVKGEKNEISKALFKKLGRTIPIDAKEDKKLVAGVVIKLGTLVIDASLENRLRRVEQK